MNGKIIRANRTGDIVPTEKKRFTNIENIVLFAQK